MVFYFSSHGGGSKFFLYAIALLFLSAVVLQSCAADYVFVSLENPNETFYEGEQMYFHLIVEPSTNEGCGGDFAVYRLPSPNREEMVLRPPPYVFTPPNACKNCAHVLPLKSKLNTTVPFTPDKVGNFFAIAKYCNIQYRVNFTVMSHYDNEYKDENRDDNKTGNGTTGDNNISGITDINDTNKSIQDNETVNTDNLNYSKNYTGNYPDNYPDNLSADNKPDNKNAESNASLEGGGEIYSSDPNQKISENNNSNSKNFNMIFLIVSAALILAVIIIILTIFYLGKYK